MAQAWEQPAWADYSGVSRTLSALSWEEVKRIVQVLEQVSHSYLTVEIKLLCSQGKRVRLDGDLTDIPVSNTSQTYGRRNRLSFWATTYTMISPVPSR